MMEPPGEPSGSLFMPILRQVSLLNFCTTTQRQQVQHRVSAEFSGQSRDLGNPGEQQSHTDPAHQGGDDVTTRTGNREGTRTAKIKQEVQKRTHSVTQQLTKPASRIIFIC